jgi:two-component system OmpR family sensor kinase
LIRAIDRLVTRHQEALEAQRRFVADAAHELRTPLAALQIQTENLISEHLPDQTRELADELRGGIRRASHLASQLLEMARTEGASLRQRQRFDLQALAASLLADNYPLAEGRHIQLAMSANGPSSVEGDPGAVHKLLAILLENAIIYSKPDGLVELRIVQNEFCTIEVIDEGPGVAEDIIPFIYDRFFRAAPPEIEGTGLGLAIAKATAEREGLRLSHRNRSDRSGLIATITFQTRISSQAAEMRSPRLVSVS